MAPILISFSRGVPSDHFLTDLGNARDLKKLPRLYANAKNRRRIWLSTTSWYDNHLRSAKFKCQLTIKTESQRILVGFPHRVLPEQMLETGLNGPHSPYSIKSRFICHALLGESGFRFMSERFGAKKFSVRDVKKLCCSRSVPNCGSLPSPPGGMSLFCLGSVIFRRL